MSIKLAIVDDDQRLAKVLKQELLEYSEIESVSLFANGHSFLLNLQTQPADQPQVVLMDINMIQTEEGIYTTQKVHLLFPQIKVIMFTIAEDDEHIFEAFKAGAVGYLLKNEKPSFILKAIVDVYQGGALMSPGVALKTIRFLVPHAEGEKAEALDFRLSDRELEVLRLVAKGHTYHSIGEQLALSAETVKKHMNNVFRKLHVRNKIEAINKSKQFL
jgi:NarL family two-component system response regulator LiaR